MGRLTLKRLRRRGQAVVELSVLLIVLVPIMFYSLFLDDLLRHRLDLLESVVSSPWDFVAIDQQDNKGAEISRLLALSWCDHTLAYNSYDKGYECSNDVHHKAFTAHVCWVVAEGQQVSCSTNKGTAKIDDNASYNGGGVTTCSARAGVFNYFIVQKALQSFSQVDLTTKDLLGGSAHGHYGKAASNIYMLEGQKFAVLHDDWATKTPDDVQATFDLIPVLPFQGDKTFKGRVAKYYDKYGDDSSAFDDAKAFFDKLDDEKLIKDSAINDGLGDDPKTLHMSFNKTPGTEFGLIKKHTSSAWSDSRVEATNGGRVDSYFGISESDW